MTKVTVEMALSIICVSEGAVIALSKPFADDTDCEFVLSKEMNFYTVSEIRENKKLLDCFVNKIYPVVNYDSVESWEFYLA